MLFLINNMSFTYNTKIINLIPQTFFINTRLIYISYEVKFFDYPIKVDIPTL